jgi:hypothetical protein
MILHALSMWGFSHMGRLRTASCRSQYKELSQCPGSPMTTSKSIDYDSSKGHPTPKASQSISQKVQNLSGVSLTP